VLGRTGSSDLLPVLNADIGGVDTAQLEGGRSNSPPYTFFLLNGDMELYRNRHFFI